MKLRNIIGVIFLLWIPVTALTAERGLVPADATNCHPLDITGYAAGTGTETETGSRQPDISPAGLMRPKDQAVFHLDYTGSKSLGDTRFVIFGDDDNPDADPFPLLPVTGLTGGSNSDTSNPSYITFMILLSVGIFGLVGIRRKRP